MEARRPSRPQRNQRWSHTSLPIARHANLPWERLLVRSGFAFHKHGESYDMEPGSEHNRVFFQEVIEEAGFGRYFDGKSFTPDVPTADEQAWLMAVECCRGGAEGGPGGFQALELNIMDTYMAGIARWVNSLGIITGGSCDGHGESKPYFGVSEQDGLILNACLSLISDRRWGFKGSTFQTGLPGGGMHDDRLEFLEIAERIYQNQDALRHLVIAARRLGV